MSIQQQLREMSDETQCMKSFVRFAAKVEITDTCWIWTGAHNGRGYGQIGRQYAHRFSYRTFIGPLIDGLEIDHLCRTPACVNPRHLEQVTHQENILRAERSIVPCPHGIRGHTKCRPCIRKYNTAYVRKMRARKKQEATA